MAIPEKVKRELVKVPKGSALIRNKVVKIEFVKVERDTTYNTRLREEHAADLVGGDKGPVRGLIYDWHIMIDGVMRGSFQRIVYGKGYYFLNLNGEYLKWGDGSGTNAYRVIEKKDDFGPIVASCLTVDHNPFLVTPKQHTAWQRAQAKKAERQRVKAHAEVCKRTIARHATQMFALIIDLAKATEVDEAQGCIERANRLLKEINLPPLEGFTDDTDAN